MVEYPTRSFLRTAVHFLHLHTELLCKDLLSLVRIIAVTLYETISIVFHCFRDGDSIINYMDNCPLTANGDQSDVDGDGIGKCLEINITLESDKKLSTVTHTYCQYPHKPLRKVKVTIYNHQVDSPFYVSSQYISCH